MSKTAIVCIGGGMHSAHGAGFLYALATELQITNPDMIVSSSGGAGNALYYATQEKEQCEAMKKIWTELLATPKFISFLRVWKIMDIDYLIDTVFRKEAPLDTHDLAYSTVQYYVGVVGAHDGEVRYVEKNDNVDPFELLRATKALPFFYGRTVQLSIGEYIDGGVGTTAQDQINFAVAQGARKILVIDDALPGTFLWKVGVVLHAFCMPSRLRRKVQQKAFEKWTHTVPEGVEIVYVSPQQLPVHIASRNKARLQEAFLQGMADALGREEVVRKLFAKD